MEGFAFDITKFELKVLMVKTKSGGVEGTRMSQEVSKWLGSMGYFT